MEINDSISIRLQTGTGYPAANPVNMVPAHFRGVSLETALCGSAVLVNVPLVSL